MEVFLVVVLLNPTDKQKFDEGTGPKIVVELKTVLAKDEAMAGARAMAFVPEEYQNAGDRLDVRVVSFRSIRSAVGTR